MYSTRKIIFLSIVTLFSIFAMLSFLNIGSEFTAERMLFDATTVNQGVPLNPTETVLGTQRQVESKLKEIIRRFPGGESAKQAHISLAAMYMQNERYSDAAAVSDKIVKRYKKDRGLVSKARFIKAKSYELKERWDKAFRELEYLQYNYGDTYLGLQVPLYIAQYNKNAGNEAEAQELCRKAVGFYKDKREKNENTWIGYMASDLLVMTYILLEEYENAGRIIKNVILNYPTHFEPQQISRIELVFTEKLNRPHETVRIFKNIIAKTENKALKNFLISRINNM
ncbi:MAG: hypothetical protein ISS34_03985 [Candidatus Omnitrophica bacterium]|nr:hypothetical protein [Candidatus Omnitrophota bacterium]